MTDTPALQPLNAQQRIALAIGSQFTEVEMLRDQVQSLINERDELHAHIAEIEAQTAGNAKSRKV